MTNSLSFPSSENVLIFLSFLKDIFTGYRILGWQFFFFQHLKKRVPHPSDLHGFWWEIYCHSNCFLPIGKMLFLSRCFQDFFLWLYISEVWLWCILAWVSLGLSCLGFTELLEFLGLCPFARLEIFHPLCLWICLQLCPLSLLSRILLTWMVDLLL